MTLEIKSALQKSSSTSTCSVPVTDTKLIGCIYCAVHVLNHGHMSETEVWHHFYFLIYIFLL